MKTGMSATAAGRRGSGPYERKAQAVPTLNPWIDNLQFKRLLQQAAGPRKAVDKPPRSPRIKKKASTSSTRRSWRAGRRAGRARGARSPCLHDPAPRRPTSAPARCRAARGRGGAVPRDRPRPRRVRARDAARSSTPVSPQAPARTWRNACPGEAPSAPADVDEAGRPLRRRYDPSNC